MQRSAEHPADLGRGASGLGVPVRCWFCRSDGPSRARSSGRVFGHDLDPQIVAAARRELEVPSDGDRAAPGVLSTATAEDAPREVELDVATCDVEVIRDCA
jgi:hypothetical protein